MKLLRRFRVWCKIFMLGSTCTLLILDKFDIIDWHILCLLLPVMIPFILDFNRLCILGSVEWFTHRYFEDWDSLFTGGKLQPSHPDYNRGL